MTTNTLARRVVLQQAASNELVHIPDWATDDDSRLALLCTRIGDVGEAYLHGLDIDGAVLSVWAACQHWLEARVTEEAR